jgi:hypothetical protein
MGGSTRRNFLQTLAAAGVASCAHPSALLAQAPSANVYSTPGFDGREAPFPIPWLDRNGSHNQMPAPNMEPAHIYHFKGKIARCNAFSGMGTDNHGNRLLFGAPSTDFSYFMGEYWAGRAAQQGAFSHI